MTDKQTILVTPVCNRAKQLIAEFGNVWVVESKTRPLPCFDGELGFGISSLDGGHYRNVRRQGDRMFTLTAIG